jgi:HAD superfamily hydrolase (TIGR01509 family)
MKPEPIRTVVFDLDNTLVDTLAIIVRAFNSVMVEHVGRDLSPPEVVAYFGPTEEDCLRAALQRPDVDPWIERFRNEYQRGVQGLTPYPGVMQILDDLRSAGTSLGLSTGKGRWTTRATLEALGMESLFDVVMTGDDVTRNKPDPEPLLRIARESGCDPKGMVMVGDSLADMASARKAGAIGLLARWGVPETRAGHEEEARSLAFAVVLTVEEMREWFRAAGVWNHHRD